MDGSLRGASLSGTLTGHTPSLVVAGPRLGMVCPSAGPIAEQLKFRRPGWLDPAADELATLRVGHDGAGRHGEDEVRPVATAAQGTATRASVRRMEAAPLPGRALAPLSLR